MPGRKWAARLIVSGYNLGTRQMLMRGAKGPPASFLFSSFPPPLLILFSIKKQPSQAFLQCSGAESQPSPPVPVTEGYCCHRTMPSVTEHSCLFISKTEMLKGNVRWERERTSRYKISRRRKQEEEHGG